MKKILSLILLSFLCSVSQAKDCKVKRDLTLNEYHMFNLAVRLDNQKVVKKMLEQCINPNQPKYADENDPIPPFLVLSLDTYSLIKNYGGDYGVKNKFGMGFFDFNFSYDRVYSFSQEYKGFFSMMANAFIRSKEALPGYVTKEDIKKHEFNKLGNKEKYNELLKFLLETNSSKIDKLIVPFRQDAAITPMHAIVYNGNYEIYNFAKNLLKNKNMMNILNEKKQPLLVLALNHNCGFDKEDIENQKKIIDDLFQLNNFKLDFTFKVNNSLSLKTSEEISFLDFMIFIKEYGNEELFSYVMDKIKNIDMEIYNKVMDGKTEFPKDIMRAGSCLTPTESVGGFYHL